MNKERKIDDDRPSSCCSGNHAGECEGSKKNCPPWWDAFVQPRLLRRSEAKRMGMVFLLLAVMAVRVW